MKKIAAFVALALAGTSVTVSAQPIRAAQAIPVPAKAVGDAQAVRRVAQVGAESQFAYLQFLPIVIGVVAAIAIGAVALGGGDSNG